MLNAGHTILQVLLSQGKQNIEWIPKSCVQVLQVGKPNDEQ